MKSCLFVYSPPAGGFSGQAAATELIIRGFHERGIGVQVLRPPGIDRTSDNRSYTIYLVYFWRLLLCSFEAIGFRFKAINAVHLTLGQTSMAMIRDGLVLTLASFGRSKRCRKVAALNGSVFLIWDYASREARLFRWVIGRCAYVTCLGKRHEEALVALGVPRHKVRVVDNVCEYEGVSDEVAIGKQADADPLEILFLSSLIDSKGFPEYLEALECLNQREGVPIRAVLCGPITITPYSERFKTVPEAQAWIENKLNAINTGQRVTAEWIPGARGEAKAQLYRQAHIFVLPTRYKVEAQPLAIIEAMSWGAAVITTNVGELPSTVDDSCAIVLNPPTPETIAEAIERLAGDAAAREDLALAGLMRFRDRFRRIPYTDTWADLLDVA